MTSPSVDTAVNSCKPPGSAKRESPWGCELNASRVDSRLLFKGGHTRLHWSEAACLYVCGWVDSVESAPPVTPGLSGRAAHTLMHQSVHKQNKSDETFCAFFNNNKTQRDHTKSSQVERGQTVPDKGYWRRRLIYVSVVECCNIVCFGVGVKQP